MLLWFGFISKTCFPDCVINKLHLALCIKNKNKIPSFMVIALDVFFRDVHKKIPGKKSNKDPHGYLTPKLFIPTSIKHKMLNVIILKSWTVENFGVTHPAQEKVRLIQAHKTFIVKLNLNLICEAKF